jgi:hypothetical protein
MQHPHSMFFAVFNVLSGTVFRAMLPAQSRIPRLLQKILPKK